MKFYLFIIALLFIGTMANGQSPFKAEPKVVIRNNPFARVSVAQPDSFLNAWRFTANVAAYGYSFGSGGTSSELSGAEFGYEHQKWNYITSTWDVKWSVNAAWFPINTALPVTLSNIQTFGVTFGFKNPLPVGNSVIQIGPDYNPNAPKNNRLGVLATIGILLN